MPTNSPRTKISDLRKKKTTQKQASTKRSPRKSRNGSMYPVVHNLFLRLLIILGSGLFCYLAYIYGVAPFKSRWKALYGKEVYPEGYSIRGIDISHHQGDINWNKLSKAEINKEPINFIFIKATEGRDFLDKNFNDNFYQAREYGFIRGAYHYFKPMVSAEKQAQYFLKQVHLEEGDLPPVLDIEETGNLDKDEIRKAALTWLKIVENHYKVPPILYTNYKFKVKYLGTEEFERYPYWIAHYYVNNLTYRGAWKFWQHTDCGRLNGIKGKVDLNIYNGSMYDLKRLCIESEY